MYGSEAIIPADIEYDSPRHALYTEEEAKQAREDGVDLKEEACLLALSRSAIYQQKLRHYHNKKIRPSLFVKATWCYAEFRNRMGSTSWHHLEKARFVISRALKNTHTI